MRRTVNNEVTVILLQKCIVLIAIMVSVGWAIGKRTFKYFTGQPAIEKVNYAPSCQVHHSVNSIIII